MATWKKVIVSGSNVSQLNNDAGYLTTGTLVVPNSFSTASFGGINLLADSPTGSLNFASSSGQGLTISANAGTDTLTFGLSAIPNSSLQNSTISGIALGGTLAALTAGAGLESAGTYTGNTARTFTLATGSTHFIQGARATISVSDTTGASGIDLTYNSTTGVISGVLQNSSLTVSPGLGLSGGGSVSLGGSTTLTVDTGSAHFQGGARGSISLTTTGNSGASTYTTSTGVLNVPNYTLAGLGGVPTTRNINTNNGLTGGGSLASDLTLGLTGQALALHNLATNGLIARTGAGTVAARTITGTTNQITVTNGDGVSANPTISLPNDLTVPSNLTVPGNLTVIGTASFQNTTNLEVADRFILLASGSNTTGDGGLVVQQATQNVGELFGWDSTFLRWGVTGSFTANTSNYVPDAFMAAVTTLASTNPNTSGPAARYSVVGNIYVSSGDESIWIYS
jgi:hypothetical protein